MRPFRQLVFLLLCTSLSAPLLGGVARAAQDEVPLSSVARAANLQFTWLGASRAAQLHGVGLVVVLRPGERLYEVNNKLESTAIPPRAGTNGELYISSALARHIVQIAAYEQSVDAQLHREYVQEVARSFSYSGAIALNVQPLKGAEAVLITGTAPPNAPVLLTLLGTISSDIPNILISRHDLTAGPDGKFQAVLPTGPDYLHNSFLRVLATSGPNVTSASAQIVLGPPNPGADVPVTDYPSNVW